jgi:hypothetical protein
MYCRNVFFILFMIAATIVPGMSRAADDEAVVETFSHAKPISARETPALSSPGLQLGTSAVAAYTVSVDPQTIAAEVARVRAQDLDSKVKMIGAHIHLPEIGTEKWEHLTGPDGAHSWRLAIRSAGAVTLRAHFTGYDPARAWWCMRIRPPTRRGKPGRRKPPRRRFLGTDRGRRNHVYRGRDPERNPAGGAGR